MSCYEYLIGRRIAYAERLLLTPNLSITEVAMQSGFNSLSTFNRIFKTAKNCTPSSYKSLNRERGLTLPVPLTEFFILRLSYMPALRADPKSDFSGNSPDPYGLLPYFLKGNIHLTGSWPVRLMLLASGWLIPTYNAKRVLSTYFFPSSSTIMRAS